MALFKEEDYGKPISEELSNYLRKHTTKFDRADVATETGVGTSTIKNVVYRTHSMTKGSSVAIESLRDKAIANCKASIAETSEDKKNLELMVKS